MSKYQEALSTAMTILAEDPRCIFIGQAVSYPGTGMTTTLTGIDPGKLLEVPVDEDLQMGMSTGLALAGFKPVSIFPRWNFLLLATNQIVNHLDKLKELTNLETPPSVVIRTGIGSISPLDPGPQHKGDFTEAFKMMCPNVDIVRLDEASQIVPAYEKAFFRSDGVSSLIVEWSDKYYE